MLYQRRVVKGITETEDIWELPCPAYCTPRLRWCESTGLLYEASTYGLGMVQPASGIREVAIVGMKGIHDFDDCQTGSPAIANGQMFILRSNGTLMCLKHP
jgi:hypothetical protein